MCKEHQGWENYPTWWMAFYIDNDSGKLEYWRGRARYLQRHLHPCEQYTSGIWDAEQSVRFMLADEMKDYFETTAEDLELDMPWGDLLGFSVGIVNWQDIAKDLIEEMENG